ncbi:carbohydrate kinase family protein [Sporolactobacillus shoreae]|uniref:Carbohydrate kinase family protein n=1 Tax=Sporolactobacillus shoreae TaxID=1465501 RepID=A0A4Z0GPN9_9BACL|nr:carbohydrate kinase family protein [Sporolactobacillus shoreae]TGA98329.1 carbohydrate kinase family protein [Sporolactobacillus shoreae]
MDSVGIVGNFNLDVVISSVDHLPDWDEEVMADSYERRVAGTAGYMGMALNALKVPSVIISSIGDDGNGKYLIDQLNSHEISTNGLVSIPNSMTPTSFVIVNELGDRGIVSVTGAHNKFSMEIYQTKKELLNSCREIVICGNYLLPGFSVFDAVKVAKEQKANGKLIYFDPSWDPNGWKEVTRQGTLNLLKYIDVFLLNETELYHLTQLNNLNASLKYLGKFCNEIIVKLGEKGSAALVNEKIFTVPAFKVSAIDTIGAGDIFDMGYLYAARKKMSVNQRLEFAGKMASLVISQKTRESYPGIKQIKSLSDHN